MLLNIKKELDEKIKEAELKNLEFGQIKITGIKIDKKWCRVF